MAMAPQQSLWEDNLPNSHLQHEDIPINGTMLLVSRTFALTEKDMATFKTEKEFENFIKGQLANDIANHLIKNKLISFTKQTNPVDYSSTYRARACLVPNEQVQILRKTITNPLISK
jgi:hypothetical protein